MRIAHISDIHWRGLKLHSVYREVFSRFFQEAKSLSVDRVVVTGDIVHSKTQGISPELIDCLTWWFRGLADVAPVIVTLGNHDGLIFNRSRMDVISPIVSAIGDDRITFIRDSKVVRDQSVGIAWCNFSCFDEDGWKSIGPTRDLVNVALFHGGVRGALTDSEWDIEGDVELSMFKRFDLGMFGDIHKSQFLDPARRFAYAGSFLQQNFGESLDKGYLLWDIESKDRWTVEQRFVESPSPFVTVGWRGTVTDTFDECLSCHKGSHFRITASSTVMPDEMKRLADMLVEEMSAIEVVWKFDGTKTQRQVEVDKAHRESLRSTVTQARLLREYLGQDSLNQTDWELVDSSVARTLSSLNGDEVKRESKWSINRMTWDNTYTYDENNVINFDSLSGVVGLFGPNRSGKSSIPGTIMYGLFNSSDRGSIKNHHIINARKNYCESKLDITVDGERLRVERITHRVIAKNGDIGGVTKMNLFRVNKLGDVLTDMSGEQRRESDKILREMIGGADDFMLTTFAAQGELNAFVKERATARKNILSRFLDLTVFDDLLAKVKEESYELKQSNRFGQRQDFEQTLSRMKSELEQAIARKTVLAGVIDTARSRTTELRVLLAMKGSDDPALLSEITRLDSEITSLAGELTLHEDDVKARNSSVDAARNRLMKIAVFKQEFPLEDIKRQINKLADLERSHLELESRLKTESLRLQQKEGSVKRLDGIPCGDQFPTCKFIKDSLIDRSSIDEQRNLVDSIKTDVSKMLETIRDLRQKSLDTKMTRYEKVVAEEHTLTKQLAADERLAQQANGRMSVTAERLFDARSRIKSLKDKYASLSTDQETRASRLELASLSEELVSNEQLLLLTERQIGALGDRIESTTSEREEFERKKALWRVYERLIAAYGRNGIPLMILSKELPKINEEIAKILQGVCGFTVVLENDESNDIDVFIDYGDSRRPIELGSGMEKMMVSLAIRVALINVSSLPKSDLFIVDEGFGALDEGNIEACNRLFDSLRKFFKTVLVISHVDGIKEGVDSMIEIVKNGKDSHIECT